MHNLPLEPGEKVIVTYHKHWVVYTIDTFVLLILLILPKIVYVWLTSGAGFFEINQHLAVFLYFIWFILLWGYFFIIWTNLYLDAWIVTDRRIIDIEQMSLFHRSVSDFRIEKIQNITVTERGFIANLFGYGSIRVETAGEKVELAFDYLPNPYKVRDTINECHDKCLARLEHSDISPATHNIIIH
ncbi:MAG: hypothetical protein A2749_01755 [Parcubacteria group bacterium RIFCSPHIGHO2_01_FULL_45_26]|nr:MAG: hypothetical protein A2749_01755 [Parcubacteria group bacterium RIFCSPHIGHO2_01_FULL_45_26]